MFYTTVLVRALHQWNAQYCNRIFDYHGCTAVVSATVTTGFLSAAAYKSLG